MKLLTPLLLHFYLVKGEERSMLGDSLYLENIEEYVQDENKIVRRFFYYYTCKLLMINMEVPTSH